MGRIADRAGRKRVIVFSAATLGIATLLTATSTSLGALLFWRFVQGVATPGVFSVTTAYVHDEWPAARAASAISAYVSGTIVGGFSGRLIAGFTAEHFSWRIAGWRWAFIVLGCISLFDCRIPVGVFARGIEVRASRGARRVDRRDTAALAKQTAGGGLQRRVLRAVLAHGDVHLRHVSPRGGAVFAGPGVDRVDLRRVSGGRGGDSSRRSAHGQGWTPEDAHPGSAHRRGRSLVVADSKPVGW